MRFTWQKFGCPQLAFCLGIPLPYCRSEKSAVDISLTTIKSKLITELNHRIWFLDSPGNARDVVLLLMFRVNCRSYSNC